MSDKTEWPKGNMSKGFQHAQLSCELLSVYQGVQFTQPSGDIGYGSAQVSPEKNLAQMCYTVWHKVLKCLG